MFRAAYARAAQVHALSTQKSYIKPTEIRWNNRNISNIFANVNVV
jgi:hypothetical protein